MTKLQEELQREEEEYEREEAELQRLDEQGNSWVYFIIVLWADYLEESAQVNRFQWTPCLKFQNTSFLLVAIEISINFLTYSNFSEDIIQSHAFFYTDAYLSKVMKVFFWFLEMFISR